MEYLKKSFEIEMSKTEQIIFPTRKPKHFPFCSLILLVVLMNSSAGLAQTSAKTSKMPLNIQISNST